MSRFGLLASLAAALAQQQPAPALPLYRDPSQPVEARVADLLPRMTLEEKVAQLLHPWPDAFTCAQLLAMYGTTSFGAVYAYAIRDCAGTQNNTEALNYLQGALTARSRLGIPVAAVSETLHSSVEGGTAFPNPTLLGSTWDTDLVQAIGGVIGLEARAAGVTRGFAPVLQVATDPRFGRYEEAFGEDPYLVSRMGVAMVQGQQGTGFPSEYLEDTEHISCEAKHAVAYAASGRDWYRADITERTLMDVYMRPWRAVIQEAGLRGLMVAHPEVAGLPMHGNGPLLSGMLRGAFGGEKMFFASDADDIHAIASHGLTTSPNASAVYALTAGMDQELVTSTFPTLADSVARGLVSESYVDAAAARILREKFALRLFDGPAYWSVNATRLAAVLDAAPHRALARQAAAQGITLLANAPLPRGSPSGPNTPLLPLDLGGAVQRVAVVGPNGGCAGGGDSCPAASAYRGGYCSGGSPTVTLLDALNALPGVNATFTPGADMLNASDTSGIPAALAAAAAAQVVIAVVGDTASGYAKGTCAEGLDADTLDLPGSQLALLAALAAQGRPLVVVGVHGRPFTLGAGPLGPAGGNNALLASLPALLAAWRPGEEGGAAIADILRGAVNPSGRLTANWVRHVGALRGPANPYFQARGSTTRAYVTEPATALFPFGWGLSYNTATITSATLTLPFSPVLPNATLTLSGTLSNAGPPGAAVLQVYFSQQAPTKWVRYASQLLAFARVALPQGPVSGVPFAVQVQVQGMEGWDSEAGAYQVHEGNYTVALGLDSASAGSQGHTWSVQHTLPSPQQQQQQQQQLHCQQRRPKPAWAPRLQQRANPRGTLSQQLAAIAAAAEGVTAGLLRREAPAAPASITSAAAARPRATLPALQLRVGRACSRHGAPVHLFADRAEFAFALGAGAGGGEVHVVLWFQDVRASARASGPSATLRVKGDNFFAFCEGAGPHTVTATFATAAVAASFVAAVRGEE